MNMSRYLLGAVFLGASLGAHALPTTVTVAGTLQSELGCPGDWDPACALTHLSYDASDDVWQNSFALPAGAYEYKAAIDDSWIENYGANATPGGANISLGLGAAATVKFYYDDKSHWITDNVNSLIAVVAGSFQSELGCPVDWDPGCLRSWLEDADGDGLYAFSALLPAGNYEAKVAINESWDLNYGAGGIQNGANIPFTSSGTAPTLFRLCAGNNLVINSSCASATVPEPATLLLLALGLTVMVAIRQRAALRLRRNLR